MARTPPAPCTAPQRAPPPPPVDCGRPGAFEKGNSVRQAPPTMSFSSSTSTRSPCLASSVAATRPLWPAPTISTSAGASASAALTCRPRRTAAAAAAGACIALGHEPSSALCADAIAAHSAGPAAPASEPRARPGSIGFLARAVWGPQKVQWRCPKSSSCSDGRLETHSRRNTGDSVSAAGRGRPRFQREIGAARTRVDRLDATQAAQRPPLTCGCAGGPADDNPKQPSPPVRVRAPDRPWVRRAAARRPHSAGRWAVAGCVKRTDRLDVHP